MSVLKIKDGNSWQSIPSIKGADGGIVTFGELDNAILLSENDDLNTLYHGEYYSNSTSLTRSIQNKPSGVTGGCLHLYCVSAGYDGTYTNYFITQLLFGSNHRLFTRQKAGAGSTWGDWGEIAVLSDIPDIPKPPTTDGNYVLKAVVSSGKAVLSWAEA